MVLNEFIGKLTIMGDILDNSVEIISTFSGFFLGGGVGGVIK
jgi:hypothetical protein